MKVEPKKTTYYFTVIRRKIDGEWQFVTGEMFTDYRHAVDYGLLYLSVENKTTFVVYNHHSLPRELKAWGIELIRGFHSKTIGDLVLF